MTPIERAARAMCAKAVELDMEDGRSWAALAEVALQALRAPSKPMIDAGVTKAEDCTDSDWDSGGDGESRNEYTYLRSDPPQQIWHAMIDAALAEG